MEATIENRIAELQQMVATFKENEPSEKQLHKYTNEVLSIRRALDKLDTALKKNNDEFMAFYNEWLERHEQNRFLAHVKSSQLDMFMDQ